MRILASTLLMLPLIATGCEKNDPLFCEKNPGASGCPRMDGSIDGRDGDPGVDARAVFGTGKYEVHINEAPMMATQSFMPGATLNTDTSPLCLTAQPLGWIEAGQPAACFVYAVNVTIQDGLDVSGNLPLVLVAADTLTLAGTLDVASHLSGAKTGPGGSFAGCKPFPAAPQSNSSIGGGGAGGSFMSQGGDGGNGGGGNAAKGTAAIADGGPPIILRGGCDGQTGALGMNQAGAKGRGGGAVYLLAGNSIQLNATAIINVSGSGAGQALKSSGGGGGGSGGMIVLYAPAIAGSGKLVANGGSGSSGASNGAGTAGSDPDPTSPTTQAPAPTSTTGGPGGVGFAGTMDAGSGTNSSNGGGGGGGAAGYIQTNVPLSGVTASPTPTVVP